MYSDSRMFRNDEKHDDDEHHEGNVSYLFFISSLIIYQFVIVRRKYQNVFLTKIDIHSFSNPYP